MHPSADIFIDESGTARQSRFLVLGALKFTRGMGLVSNELTVFKDQAGWRGEAHFSNINRDTGYMFREALNILKSTNCRFTFNAVVYDTQGGKDPFKGKEAWRAHAQQTIQVVQRSLSPDEIAAITVDNISVPTEVDYDAYVRVGVNKSLNRFAAASVCRMDSKACWGLQLADILTSAVGHQYRQGVDPKVKAGSPKGIVANHAAEVLGVESLCNGKSRTFHVHELTTPRKPVHLSSAS